MLLQEYDEAKQRELDRRDNYEDGLNDGKSEDLLMILAAKGDVPKSVASKILCEKNTKKLMDWLKSAVYSDTIDDFRNKTGL